MRNRTQIRTQPNKNANKHVYSSYLYSVGGLWLKPAIELALDATVGTELSGTAPVADCLSDEPA